MVRAKIPEETNALMRMDKTIFGNRDVGNRYFWDEIITEAWWVVVDGKRIGTTALQANSGMSLRVGTDCPEEIGTLFVCSTGLLPKWHKLGIGTLVKAWQIAHARHEGYAKLLTCVRVSNQASIMLNQKLGFAVREVIEDFYSNPTEHAVVLELSIMTGEQKT